MNNDFDGFFGVGSGGVSGCNEVFGVRTGRAGEGKEFRGMSVLLSD